MNRALFVSRVKKYQDEIIYYQKKYNGIANLRLLILVVGIAIAYVLTQTQEKTFYAIGITLCIVFFLYLIYKHGKIRIQKDYAQRMKEVNEKYLMRLENGWETFEDKGEDFIDHGHPYANDLDIFGKGSLFQKMNIACTFHGRRRLAEVLNKASFDEAQIIKRQQSIKELSHKLDFCQRLEAIASKKQYSEKQLQKLIHFVKGDWQTLKLSKVKKLIYSLPWLFIAWGMLSYITGNKLLIGSLAILIVINCCIQLLLGYKIAEAKSTLMAIGYSMKPYEEVLKVVLQEEFTSPYLKDCLQELYTTKGSALEGLKEIEKIGQIIQITYQPLLAIPLNAIWFWDFKTLLRFDKWCQNYGEHFEKWLEVIGEIESLVSLSVMTQVEDVHFPLITPEQKIIAKQLGHPLIQTESRVRNDISIGEACLIITGSNMSGKTTFLRTVGINLVLAYAGAPVIAREMECGVMPIYTSMRITDDLSGGVSTFYAELKRIKQMIDASKKERIVFLIDEIFRGTNSKDRIIGAKSVVKCLTQQGAVGGMTTHDLELCQLEEKENVCNYHFTEYYEEEGIKFDYTIKEGPSVTTNAKYLMALVGIDVVDE